jgi:hypothetical protein
MSRINWVRGTPVTVTAGKYCGQSGVIAAYALNNEWYVTLENIGTVKIIGSALKRS